MLFLSLNPNYIYITKSDVPSILNNSFIDGYTGKHWSMSDINLKQYISLIKTNALYFFDLKTNHLYKAELFDKHYYKLAVFDEFGKIPILEIDGFRMQLLGSYKNAKHYAEQVVNTIFPKSNQKIFETCFGLGYVSEQFIKKQNTIISCEISKAVLDLAKINPCSPDLNNKSINVKNTDAFLEISNYENEFDIVFHDPPTFSQAENLYSPLFYRNVYNALNPRGYFYHYIGHSKKLNLKNQVMQNMKKAGFVVKELNHFQALLGIKQ